MLDRARHGRQIRLVEIGEAGQARLCGARVALGARGFARTVEERYVRGAGMLVAGETSAASPEPAGARAAAGPGASGAGEPPAVAVSDLGLRHDAAREVADGALRALSAIRAALGWSP